MSRSRSAEVGRLFVGVLAAATFASFGVACSESKRDASQEDGAPAGDAAGDAAGSVEAPAKDAVDAPALRAKVDASHATTVLASEVKRACPEGMALVPGGTLTPLEKGRSILVADFCMDVHEVTVAELRKTTQLSKRTDWGSVDDDWIASHYCNAGREGRDEHPANCVSIDEARSHCASRAARLPGGDEWEWAARGGEAMSTPWGSPVASDEICWGRPSKRDGTCVSGDHAKDKTAAGIVDLGGNVSEWTEASSRVHVQKTARLAHGASWYAIDDGYARAALGGFETPAVRAETIGFRCASDVTR